MSRELGLDDEAALMSAMNTVHDLAAATGRLLHLTSWLARPVGPVAGGSSSAWGSVSCSTASPGAWPGRRTRPVRTKIGP